jgi:hypothetical protein
VTHLKRFQPILLAVCVCAGALLAQTTAKAPPAADSSPKKTTILMSGPPRVGKVEVYGNERLDAAKLAQVAGVRLGEALTTSRREAEERLEKEAGIIEAHVEGHCCLGQDIVLYIGVLESGSKPFALHSPPREDLALPTKIDLVYQRLVRALEAAHERGAVGESYDRGYPLSEDPEARRAQETLALVVDPYVEDLGQILRNATDEPVRAAAAYILAFTKHKAKAEPHLQYALRDFDPDVRLNALRSLEFVRQALEAVPPDADGNRKTVSPTWLIEMLQAVTLQDRVEASRMLVRMVQRDNQSALQQMEERALPALVQMAKWTLPEHAQAAYTLLGRIAGLPEDKIQSSFRDNRRETVLEPIRERVKAKKRFLVF